MHALSFLPTPANKLYIFIDTTSIKACAILADTVSVWRMTMKYQKLNNGILIPKLGYGVYRIPENGKTKECVLKALKAWYRHIDTAQAYYNEKEVGEAIKESKIPRNEIFLTN